MSSFSDILAFSKTLKNVRFYFLAYLSHMSRDIFFALNTLDKITFFKFYIKSKVIYFFAFLIL
jgi:hypothetical protein